MHQPHFKCSPGEWRLHGRAQTGHFHSPRTFHWPVLPPNLYSPTKPCEHRQIKLNCTFIINRANILLPWTIQTFQVCSFVSNKTRGARCSLGLFLLFFCFYLCLFRNSTNSVSTLCTLGADGVIWSSLMQGMDGFSPGRGRLIHLPRVPASLRNINEVGLNLKTVQGIMDW